MRLGSTLLHGDITPPDIIFLPVSLFLENLVCFSMWILFLKHCCPPIYNFQQSSKSAHVCQTLVPTALHLILLQEPDFSFWSEKIFSDIAPIPAKELDHWSFNGKIYNLPYPF